MTGAIHSKGRWWCGLSIAFATALPAQDLTFADFEGDDYDGWTATGDAFGRGPARGALPQQMVVEGFHGRGLVSSYVGGDRSTGTLTSPEFTIERPFLNFLIGGGGHRDGTCVDLMVAGERVRTACGTNLQAGGSERLRPCSWDVRELRGQRARIVVVDRETGGWGHVNVDHFVQGDQPTEVQDADRTRKLRLDERWLLLPIDDDGPSTRLRVSLGDRVLHDFDVQLANGVVDWWACLDLQQFVGQEVALQVADAPDGVDGLRAIVAAAEPRHLRPRYDEALRPQLRMSQQFGWNNDPNGMVYLDGEWHLFWQSNPFGAQWANMYWGHAVSTDLVHWHELPLALQPRTMAKELCYSGSAHVDASGRFAAAGQQVLVAAFTDTGCGEALAVSRDRGRSFEYLPQNPVIRHQGRDPKLVWYEPGRHWVIAVYDEHEGRQAIVFHTSTDLEHWQVASRLDGWFECPELVELPVDGDAADRRWVLFAADARYVIGRFDGRVFTPEGGDKLQLHHGAFYASQCFNRAPGARCVQIGWARIDMPGMPFNQAFSLPIELSLRRTADGVRLFGEPVAELTALRDAPLAIDDEALVDRTPVRLATAGQLFDVLVEMEPREAKQVALTFGSNRIVYDVATQRLDGMPLPLEDGRLRFRVVVDRPMFEVCGGGGRVYRTAARSDGGRELPSFELCAYGGDARLVSWRIHPMRSIW